MCNVTDYYPFGMPMPNRNIQDANGYRYAYQGQEKDPETGKEAFELRLWDGRIGRWLTTDPAKEFHSPYLGIGNDPINYMDVRGDTIRRGNNMSERQFQRLLPKLKRGSTSAFNLLNNNKINTFIHIRNTPFPGNPRLMAITTVQYTYKNKLENMSVFKYNTSIYSNSEFNTVSATFLGSFSTQSLSKKTTLYHLNSNSNKSNKTIIVKDINIEVRDTATPQTFGDEFGHATYALENPFNSFLWSLLENRILIKTGDIGNEGSSHYLDNPSGNRANNLENNWIPNGEADVKSLIGS